MVDGGFHIEPPHIPYNNSDKTFPKHHQQGRQNPSSKILLWVSCKICRQPFNCSLGAVYLHNEIWFFTLNVYWSWIVFQFQQHTVVHVTLHLWQHFITDWLHLTKWWIPSAGNLHFRRCLNVNTNLIAIFTSSCQAFYCS